MMPTLVHDIAYDCSQGHIITQHIWQWKSASDKVYSSSINMNSIIPQ